MKYAAGNEVLPPVILCRVRGMAADRNLFLLPRSQSLLKQSHFFVIGEKMDKIRIFSYFQLNFYVFSTCFFFL